MDTVRPFGHSTDIEEEEMTNPLEEKGLTRREIEVLEWVARGKTNTEIGMILHISPRTASKHLEHIYTKLGVESRTAAVVTFLEMLQHSRAMNQAHQNMQKVSEIPPAAS